MPQLLIETLIRPELIHYAPSIAMESIGSFFKALISMIEGVPQQLHGRVVVATIFFV